MGEHEPPKAPPLPRKSRAATMRNLVPRRFQKDVSAVEAAQRAEEQAKRRELVHNLHPSMRLDGAPFDERMEWRQRIHFYMERPMRTSVGKVLLCLLMLCILASILTYYLSSLPGLRYHPTIRATEWVCTIVFSVELLVRLVAGSLDPWHMLDLTLLIDAASVTPFYLELALLSGSAEGESADTPIFVQLLQLLRLLRVLKLLRHYSGWRVLSIAIHRSWRAVAVPVFAMILAVFLLSGLLFALEASYTAQQQATGSGGGSVSDQPQGLPDALESMWLCFWLVTTLGFDGDFGSEQPASRLVIAVALLCGLLLTTMPITVLGSAFASAWEQKEVVEVAMKVQELLLEHGHSADDVKLVFDAFDTDGSRALDWTEFKSAMRVLHINLPLLKMRSLFTLFDADESGTIDNDEFCRLLFPHSVTEQPVGGDGDETSGDAAASTGAQAAGGDGAAGQRRGNWRSTVGAASWHEWRNNPNTKRLLNPMLLVPAAAMAQRTREAAAAGDSDGAAKGSGGKSSPSGGGGSLRSRTRDPRNQSEVEARPVTVKVTRPDASSSGDGTSGGVSGSAAEDPVSITPRGAAGKLPPLGAVPLPDSASATPPKDAEMRNVTLRLERLEASMQQVLDLLRSRQEQRAPPEDKQQ